MSTGRSSGVVIIARMFLFILAVSVGSALFFNSLSERNMFPVEVAVMVAIFLTAFFVGIGWLVVTLGSNAILRDDPEFERWKQEGGRPYLDHLPRPINPDSDQTRNIG